MTDIQPVDRPNIYCERKTNFANIVSNKWISFTNIWLHAYYPGSEMQKWGEKDS